MEQNLQELADLIAANTVISTKNILTLDECAKYTGLSKSTLYKMTMRKQIPHSKPNGKVCYFDRLELEKWLMSNRVATENELNDKAEAYCRKGGRL